MMAGVAVSVFARPALANDWEGLSLGIGGGYGMANSRVVDSATVIGTTLSETTNGIPGSGGLFTLSAGYDHALLGALVVGGFIDYDFANIDSRSLDSLTGFATGKLDIDRQLSIGGRLGYLVAPTTLFFSTFGYAHVDASGVRPTFDFGNSHGGFGNFDGYFVGGGVETLIGGGFSLKAEYRYTSLQSEETKSDFGSFGSLGTTVKPEIQTARLSLNYRFGDGKHEPVDNSIPPVTSSWTSPYFGLGGGAGIADTKLGIADDLDAGSTHLGNDGAFLSFTAGYDYQLNPRFVLGAFADAAYTNFGYDATLRIASGPDGESETIRNKFGNLLMAGARLGYLTTPDTLLFVSGGYANAGLSDTHLDARLDGISEESATIDGHRFSGGFLGGGIETRINDALSIKAEYRYVDFGSEVLSGGSASTPAFEITPTRFDPSLQIGMLSINWRLGTTAAQGSKPLD
jgi:outer membrane immunogenic protein